MAQRINGVVKWFSAEKGYGFITPENGPDVFVHYTAIQSSGYRKLEAGEKVEFEILAESNQPQSPIDDENVFALQEL